MSFIQKYTVSDFTLDCFRRSAETALESKDIDKSLVSMVRLINSRLGVATAFCCSGHSKARGRGYMVLVFTEKGIPTIEMYMERMLGVMEEHKQEVKAEFCMLPIPPIPAFQNSRSDSYSAVTMRWSNYNQLRDIYRAVLGRVVDNDIGDWIRLEREGKQAMGTFGVEDPALNFDPYAGVQSTTKGLGFDVYKPLSK